MTELPSGTVTFLFTDIESSTALLRQLGRDRDDEALAEHTFARANPAAATFHSASFAVVSDVGWKACVRLLSEPG